MIVAGNSDVWKSLCSNTIIERGFADGYMSLHIRGFEELVNQRRSTSRLQENQQNTIMLDFQRDFAGFMSLDNMTYLCNNLDTWACKCTRFPHGIFFRVRGEDG